MIPLLVVAGEASGDLHGARLLEELARLGRPVEAFGLGGDELRKAGLETLADSAEISVVGLAEALRILPRARQIFRQLLSEVERRRPPAAVLVDFPEFNLRLARQLRRRGVKVIYYVSPQVWAWRRRRVETIRKVVDRMLVLFPFEEEFYHWHGVPALCVGHPLVDEVPELPQAWDHERRAGEPFRVALLPGSRRSEISALLPLMVGAVERLAARLPIQASVVRAPTVTEDDLSGMTRGAAIPLPIVAANRFDHLAGCHLAFCASGTATLELGLLGTPLLVLYHLNRWTYLLARLLVKLPHISLVNLVLGRTVVPELLQHEAEPANVAAVAEALLTDPARVADLRSGLALLRGKLGASGAAARAAAALAAELPAEGAA